MLWVKSFHVLFVVSWFVGLFYLPRIYVNLAQVDDRVTYDRLLGMARRLYRFITPIGGLALIFGLWLFLGYGIGMGSGWMHAKLLLVVLLLIYHFLCRRMLQDFEQHQNTRSHTFYRWFNEAPVLLLLLILILAIVKPF